MAPPASPAVKTIPSGPAQETLDMVDVNRTLLARYQLKLRNICPEKLMIDGKSLVDTAPPKIGVNGAAGHPFEPCEFDKCMTSAYGRSEYVCMVNMFWLDILRLAVPGVPLNQGAIDHFRKHFFDQGPRPIPAETAIAVIVGEVGGLAPPLGEGGLAPHQGKLRRASGCEAVLAFIDAMAEAVEADSVAAQAWAKAALQTPVVFINFGGVESDILKYAIQAKHNWKKVGDAMALNTLQFIYQVMVTKNVVAQNGGGSGDLKHEIEAFYKGIQVADEDQKVTSEVAARCAKLYHELLSNEKVVRILTQAEQEFVGQPHAFKGWTKLEAIYRKAAGVPEGARRGVLEFMVESLYHLQASGAMAGGEFSKRVLAGEGRKTVSLLDVLAHRLAIAQKAVALVPNATCRPSLKDLIAPRVCAKLMMCGGLAPTDGGGLAPTDEPLAYDDDEKYYGWSAQLSQSGVLVAEALRDLHAGELDGCIRYILKEKRGATMEEVFQTGAIKDMLSHIAQQVQAETLPAPVEPEATPAVVADAGGLAPHAAKDPGQDAGGLAPHAAPTQESEMQELISQWLKHVRGIWRRRVNLILAPAGSHQVLLDALKRTPAGQYGGGAGGVAPRDGGGAGGVAPREGGRRAFILDAKVGRQSFSDLRFGETLPLERADVERVQKIVTSMTDTPGVTLDGDLVFVFDGKHGETRHVVSKVFPSPEWKETEYNLVYKYEDLDKRMHHTRSETIIRLTERLTVLGVKPLRLPLKKRLFFGGSNRCDAFVNVPLEFDGEAGAASAVPVCQKREMLQGRAGASRK